MKNAIVKLFIKAGLLVAVLTVGVSAHAQTLQYKLTANIPFDFTLSDEKLPAGTYSVSRANETSGDMVLQVRSTDGHSIVTRFSLPIVTFAPKKKNTLVFHRYGDKYFLSQVWSAGGGTGRAFPKTRAERDLERNAQDNVVGAVKTPKREVVAITATLQ